MQVIHLGMKCEVLWVHILSVSPTEFLGMELREKVELHRLVVERFEREEPMFCGERRVHHCCPPAWLDPRNVGDKKKESCSSGTRIIVGTWFREVLLGLCALFGQLQNIVMYCLLANPVNFHWWQYAYKMTLVTLKKESLWNSLSPTQWGRVSSLIFSNHNWWKLQFSLQTGDHSSCLTNDSSNFHL